MIVVILLMMIVAVAAAGCIARRMHKDAANTPAVTSAPDAAAPMVATPGETTPTDAVK